MTVLKVFKTDPAIKLPSYATTESACFDVAYQRAGKAFVQLYDQFNEKSERQINDDGSIELWPGDRVMVPTGLIFDIPPGYVVKLYARCSTGLKKGLKLSNAIGIIDADYYHETFILITNETAGPVIIEDGERLGQAELVKVDRVTIEETAVPPKQTTERVGGFGSTGATISEAKVLELA